MSCRSYEGGFTVTPHATNVQRADALFVGGAGNIACQGEDGNDVTLTGVLAGALIPLRVTRVYVTGTTATNIRGLLERA